MILVILVTPFLRTPAFIFCLPWGGEGAIRGQGAMDPYNLGKALGPQNHELDTNIFPWRPYVIFVTVGDRLHLILYCR